jgi:hypothetical protein
MTSFALIPESPFNQDFLEKHGVWTTEQLMQEIDKRVNAVDSPKQRAEIPYQVRREYASAFGALIANNGFARAGEE